MSPELKVDFTAESETINAGQRPELLGFSPNQNLQNGGVTQLSKHLTCFVGDPVLQEGDERSKESTNVDEETVNDASGSEISKEEANRGSSQVKDGKGNSRYVYKKMRFFKL